jgi:glutamate-1-semialdehyde 2,1-aminomutase
MTVTYNRMPDSMAASLATIERLDRGSGPTRLSVLGQRLKDGLDRVARLAGVAATSIGLPATPFIQFDYDSETVRDHAMKLFCNGMLRRGVLLTPAHHWFLCTSMREQDIDETVGAASQVFEEIKGKL